MSDFVMSLVYEVRTTSQSVAGATARSVDAAQAGVDASASVGAGAEDIAGAHAGATGSAAAIAGDGDPCRAGVGVDAQSSGRSA